VGAHVRHPNGVESRGDGGRSSPLLQSVFGWRWQVTIEATINELIADAHETAVSKGWWEKHRRALLFMPELKPDLVVALLGLVDSETAEAMEEVRAGVELNKLWFDNDGKPLGVASELADVLIRVFDMAGEHEIPLAEALVKKLAYNKTRAYRHGGKLV